MLLIVLVIGLVLGFTIAKLIPKFKDSISINNNKRWRIKFNCYFVIHEDGRETNNIVRTPSIEIFVNAENESDATDLILEMVENELRVDIENIELWLLNNE
jgi:hypothetical protein